MRVQCVYFEDAWLMVMVVIALSGYQRDDDHLPEGSGESAGWYPLSSLHWRGWQLGQVVHTLGSWGRTLAEDLTRQRIDGWPGVFASGCVGWVVWLLVSKFKVGLHVVLLGWRFWRRGAGP